MRAKRLESRHTIEQASELIGVNKRTLNTWELNQHAISRRFLPNIEQYLGYLPKGFELSLLAKRVIEYRNKENLTIKELGKLWGMDYETIQKIEKNEGYCQTATKQKVESLLTH